MYHRGFFEAHQGTQERQVTGVMVRTTQRVVGNRLHVHIAYAPGESDSFEWQIYTPNEFIALANACGFTNLLACANFDEGTAPTTTLPRMQMVFERDAEPGVLPTSRLTAALTPSREAVDFIARATNNPVFQSLMARLSAE